MAEQVGAEWQDKVIHASLMVGPVLLMGGDPPPGRFVPPAGVSVSIGVDDPAEAERLFAGLAEEGTVCMPIGETFWAVRFGMVTDRFGIPWMVNCEKR
jgi:PhnB protein